jgi:hypothetical protein
MTLIGLIVLGILVIGLLCGRNAYNHVFVATIGFNDSSIIQSGSIAVSPFYAAAIIWLLANCTIWSRRRERHGQVIAISFVAFIAVLTALGPTLFHGMGVVASDIGLDQQAGNLSPLAYSTSNIAQVAYLAIAIAVFSLNTRDGIAERHVVTGLVVGSLTALSSMVISSWPHAVFDNRGDGFYSIETIRVRGQFAEPSHLGVFALVCCIFFVTRLASAATLRNVLVNSILALMGAVLLAVSATGTALIGLPVAVVVAGSLLFVRWAKNGRRVSPLTFISLAFVPPLVTVVLLRYWSVALEAIVAKTGSTSFSTRSFVDGNAIRVFVESWFLGVGAGSNRASSLFLMALSQLGLIGTLLFLLLMWSAIRAGYSHAAAVASASGLVAFLCAAFVSFADLVSPIMWILATVSASALPQLQHPAGPVGRPSDSFDHQLNNKGPHAHRPHHEHLVPGQAGRPRALRP